jgi:hypothetical protein
MTPGVGQQMADFGGNERKLKWAAQGLWAKIKNELQNRISNLFKD